VEREKEGVFATPDLRLKVLDGKPFLREGSENKRELIIEFSLEEGQSEFVFEYEPLR
jgi:hypothetical protein